MQVGTASISVEDRYLLASPENMAQGQLVVPQVKYQSQKETNGGNTRVSEIERTPHIARRLGIAKRCSSTSHMIRLNQPRLDRQPLSLQLYLVCSLQSSPLFFTPSPHFCLERLLLNAQCSPPAISLLTLCSGPKRHGNIGNSTRATLHLIRQ
jgi:hypothetical protein